MSEIVALLLSAGESTRMGQSKALLPWAGVSLIEWQVEQLRKAGVNRVIAVLGHGAAEVSPAARRAGADVVVNADYTSGRASSLRKGAEAVGAAEAIVVLNVDQPRPAWVSRRLIEAWRASRQPIVVPAHDGHGGHPIVLDRALIPDLQAVRDETLGLRAITERMRGETESVVFENSVVIVDLNTPEDYAAALADFSRGAWENT